MMRIAIKNYNYLDTIKENKMKQATIELDIPTGSNISDMLKLLSLDESTIGSILINNELSNNNQLLRDGDIVVILPLLFGG